MKLVPAKRKRSSPILVFRSSTPVDPRACTSTIGVQDEAAAPGPERLEAARRHGGAKLSWRVGGGDLRLVAIGRPELDTRASDSDARLVHHSPGDRYLRTQPQRDQQ